jgi:hypothetical protein
MEMDIIKAAKIAEKLEKNMIRKNMINTKTQFYNKKRNIMKKIDQKFVKNKKNIMMKIKNILLHQNQKTDQHNQLNLLRKIIKWQHFMCLNG